MDKEVSDRMKNIEERLNVLEKIIREHISYTVTPTSKPTQLGLGLNELLALPSSLQKSMLAVQELGEATASNVAEKTERDRTVENIYLNQLVRLKYINKERRGRKIYFKVLRYY
jgi:Holliday junction resolvasome RuvABC ATP-dependent DNA helicase subunit